MTAAVCFVSLMVIAGCRSKGSATLESGVESEGSTLMLTLSTDASSAREPVSFSVVWVDADGTETPAEAATLLSDLEDPLSIDGAALIATVAGSHTLTAKASNGDDEAQTADASLSVAAGQASVILIELSESTVVAADPVSYTVSAEDAFGNAVATDDAEIASDESVTISDDTLTSTLAGEHSVTADLGDLQDTASWTVVAGAAAEIDLMLTEVSLEVGDSTGFSVVVTDAYGNETDDPTEVGVDEDGAVVTEEAIEFQS